MPQQNDNSFSQLTRLIRNFNSQYESLTNAIYKCNNRFNDSIRKAECSLSSYTKTEKDALIKSKKIIHKIMNGSSFINNKGINKILEQRLRDSTLEVSKTIQNFHDIIDKIINEFPDIKGKKTQSLSKNTIFSDELYVLDGQKGRGEEKYQECPSCGAKLTGENKFCTVCGTNIEELEELEDEEEEYQECPSCGAKLIGENKFCTVCGTNIEELEDEEEYQECPSCGAKLIGENRFCTVCGTNIEDLEEWEELEELEDEEEEYQECPSCGAKLIGENKFCTICGTNIEELEDEEEEYQECPSCGAKLIGENKFCTVCGTNIEELEDEEEYQECPSCGAKLIGENRFCTVCGTNIEELVKNNVDEILILDKNIEVLDIRAINNPKLKTIVLTNVKTINVNAFQGCSNLELIVINKGIDKISINAFRGVNEKCILAFKDTQETILSKITDDICIDNKHIIFNYNPDIEQNVIVYKKETKNIKKIIIRQNTPLDNDAIKALFLQRNNKCGLTIDELNAGITLAQSNINKDKILYYAALERRKRALIDNNLSAYRLALSCALKCSLKIGTINESLAIIFGILFLDSSGYEMGDLKQNVKVDPQMLFYHPDRELNYLYKIVSENNISKDKLIVEYKLSVFVNELNNKLPSPYYTIDNSIKLMLMALENPNSIFFPAKSGIIRIN